MGPFSLCAFMLGGNMVWTELFERKRAQYASRYREIVLWKEGLDRVEKRTVARFRCDW